MSPEVLEGPLVGFEELSDPLVGGKDALDIKYLPPVVASLPETTDGNEAA